MAQKNHEDNLDAVFEFVQILPVNEIAMSDNRESRPKEVKRSLWRPCSNRKHQIRHGDSPSGPK